MIDSVAQSWLNHKRREPVFATSSRSDLRKQTGELRDVYIKAGSNKNESQRWIPCTNCTMMYAYKCLVFKSTFRQHYHSSYIYITSLNRRTRKHALGEITYRWRASQLTINSRTQAVKRHGTAPTCLVDLRRNPADGTCIQIQHGPTNSSAYMEVGAHGTAKKRGNDRHESWQSACWHQHTPPAARQGH